tara:strand:- start:1804 stop:2490 length:687 start_codon:yes stop_codon:yes gene_type:complete
MRIIICLLITAIQFHTAFGNSETMLSETLNRYIETSLNQTDSIPENRRQILDQIAKTIKKQQQKNQPINLNFICTHNSRRSHLSQIWAQTAAAYFGIERIYAYSGGTESTAFNPRAVAAIQRAGFQVDKTTASSNPVYHTRFSTQHPPLTNFSKVFDQAPNPSEGFIAVMTCDDADKKCPAVFGSDARIALTYKDPKAFDGTDRETLAYDERCRQISREQLYIFQQLQ